MRKKTTKKTGGVGDIPSALDVSPCLTGLTMVASTATCAPCHSGKTFATTSTRPASCTDTSIYVHVHFGQTDIGAHPRTGLTAKPGHSALQRQCARGERLPCCQSRTRPSIALLGAQRVDEALRRLLGADGGTLPGVRHIGQPHQHHEPQQRRSASQGPKSAKAAAKLAERHCGEHGARL